jgi:hypothetical protein
MRISRKFAALGAFFVLAAAILAGCGSSGSSNTVGKTSVAVVAGNQISVKSYKHWMYVAAKGQAAQEAEQGETGAPVIAPNDPPKFASCIKQVRVQVPTLAKTSDAKIKTDCGELFSQLNPEVIGFLVAADWYQADAHKLGVTVTDKQVNAAYAKEKKAEFPTAAEYKAYLSEGGLTDADVRYEVRVNTVYVKLLKRYAKKVTQADISAYYKKHASTFKTETLSKASKTIQAELEQTAETAAEPKVTALSKKYWGKRTLCAKQYTTATYCANYKAPKKSAATSTSAAATSTAATSTASSTAASSTTTASK